ncbi:hypothetical protein [Undibacterium luofuense]|uniref:Uncharacterized protein n=1 Tax=Undibacterium luofuense TaxID=2828733 RepID=A0A941I5L4_9BURK|nr:hypothetical protein [Undibacterium luofuense]MBR7781721.1 hypothetical protein [Undibacterium luofuense]
MKWYLSVPGTAVFPAAASEKFGSITGLCCFFFYAKKETISFFRNDGIHNILLQKILFLTAWRKCRIAGADFRENGIGSLKSTGLPEAGETEMQYRGPVSTVPVRHK